MDIGSTVAKITEEINGENRKDVIDALEKALVENFDEISKKQEFFHLPLANIFSFISKIQFNPLNEEANNINALKNFVLGIINAHFEEKTTLLILQNMNIAKYSLQYEEFISIMETFKKCTILNQFCQLNKEKCPSLEEDKDFELKQKEQEIEKLKQQIKELESNQNVQIVFQPILQKPQCFQKSIFQACKEGNLPSVQWLIEIENVSINKRFVKKSDEEKNLYTPLHYACEYSQLLIVQYLIYKGANIEAKSHSNDYPIHCASKGGLLPVVQYLIEKHNIDVDIRGSCKKTPLQYACLNGHLSIAEYLISKGANVKAKDEYKDFVIHYACMGGLLPIVQYLIEKQNVAVDIKNGSHDMTPLHYACSFGHLKIAEYLISKGADVYAKNFSGNSVIHYACKSGLLPIVQYLIEEKYIYVDIKGYSKRTPLHFAAKYGHLQVVKYLISKGANKDAKDDFSNKPYELAHNAKIQRLLV